MRQAHICHLGSLHTVIFLWVINTHFQNHSSWMPFESGQTCPTFEKHTHTSLGAVCFPPIHATPEMERRWVGFYRGFSTPSVFTDCGTKTPHYCSLDSTVKLKLKWYTLKQTNKNKTDWGQGRPGGGFASSQRDTLTSDDTWLLGNWHMGKSLPAHAGPSSRAERPQICSHLPCVPG